MVFKSKLPIPDVSYLPVELFGVEPTFGLPTGTSGSGGWSGSVAPNCPSGWLPHNTMLGGANIECNPSYPDCCRFTVTPPTNTTNTITPPATVTPVGLIGCTQVQTIAITGGIPPGPVTQEECSVCPDGQPFRCRYVSNNYVLDFCCADPNPKPFPGFSCIGCGMKAVVITPPPVVPPVPPVTPPTDGSGNNCTPEGGTFGGGTPGNFCCQGLVFVVPPGSPPGAMGVCQQPASGGGSSGSGDSSGTGTGDSSGSGDSSGGASGGGSDAGGGGEQPIIPPAVIPPATPQKDYKPYVLGVAVVGGLLGLLYYANKHKGGE